MQTCPLVVKYKPSIQHLEKFLILKKYIYIGKRCLLWAPMIPKFYCPPNKQVLSELYVNFGNLYLEREIFWFNFYGAKIVDCGRKCVT